MKLDRNINANKRGKYAILNLRKLDDFIEPSDPFQQVAKPIANAIKMLEDAGILDWGLEGTESEFFLVKLKDRFAGYALSSYAEAAQQHDPEYARDIRGLVLRSGPNSPFCKFPD